MSKSLSSISSFLGFDTRNASLVSLNSESSFGAEPALVLYGFPSLPFTVPKPRCSKVVFFVYPNFSQTRNTCLKCRACLKSVT